MLGIEKVYCRPLWNVIHLTSIEAKTSKWVKDWSRFIFIAFDNITDSPRNNEETTRKERNCSKPPRIRFDDCEKAQKNLSFFLSLAATRKCNNNVLYIRVFHQWCDGVIFRALFCLEKEILHNWILCSHTMFHNSLVNAAEEVVVCNYCLWTWLRERQIFLFHFSFSFVSTAQRWISFINSQSN